MANPIQPRLLNIMKEKSPSEISPLMKELSEYIAGALKQPLPKDVVEKTKHHVLDTIAAMVSGSRLLPGRRARKLLPEHSIK